LACKRFFECLIKFECYFVALKRLSKTRTPFLQIWGVSEEILEQFCLYCIDNEDKMLFQKALEDQTDNFNIDGFCSYLIIYSDHEVWSDILMNLENKENLTNSLHLAFILNCKPFLNNIDYNKNDKIDEIKQFSFIHLLMYIHIEPFENTDFITSRVNQPDFSFPFDLKFNLQVANSDIIKLEQESFKKGFSVLYLMPEWTSSLDSYFNDFFIDYEVDDLIEFNEYVKNNGEKNLLSLNIKKF